MDVRLPTASAEEPVREWEGPDSARTTGGVESAAQVAVEASPVKISRDHLLEDKVLATISGRAVEAAERDDMELDDEKYFARPAKTAKHSSLDDKEAMMVDEGAAKASARVVAEGGEMRFASDMSRDGASSPGRDGAYLGAQILKESLQQSYGDDFLSPDTPALTSPTATPDIPDTDPSVVRDVSQGERGIEGTSGAPKKIDDAGESSAAEERSGEVGKGQVAVSDPVEPKVYIRRTPTPSPRVAFDPVISDKSENTKDRPDRMSDSVLPKLGRSVMSKSARPTGVAPRSFSAGLNNQSRRPPTAPVVLGLREYDEGSVVAGEGIPTRPVMYRGELERLQRLVDYQAATSAMGTPDDWEYDNEDYSSDEGSLDPMEVVEHRKALESMKQSFEMTKSVLGNNSLVQGTALKPPENSATVLNRIRSIRDKQFNNLESECKRADLKGIRKRHGMFSATPPFLVSDDGDVHTRVIIAPVKPDPVLSKRGESPSMAFGYIKPERKLYSLHDPESKSNSYASLFYPRPNPLHTNNAEEMLYADSVKARYPYRDNVNTKSLRDPGAIHHELKKGANKVMYTKSWRRVDITNHTRGILKAVEKSDEQYRNKKKVTDPPLVDPHDISGMRRHLEQKPFAARSKSKGKNNYLRNDLSSQPKAEEGAGKKDQFFISGMVGL